MNLLQSVHLVHMSLSYLNKSHGIIVPVSSGSGVSYCSDLNFSTVVIVSQVLRPYLKYQHMLPANMLYMVHSTYVVGPHYYTHFTGFFKSLNQEFVLTNTSVSITIMPLPYVLTETV